MFSPLDHPGIQLRGVNFEGQAEADAVQSKRNICDWQRFRCGDLQDEDVESISCESILWLWRRKEKVHIALPCQSESQSFQQFQDTILQCMYCLCFEYVWIVSCLSGLFCKLTAVTAQLCATQGDHTANRVGLGANLGGGKWQTTNHKWNFQQLNRIPQGTYVILWDPVGTWCQRLYPGYSDMFFSSIGSHSEMWSSCQIEVLGVNVWYERADLDLAADQLPRMLQCCLRYNSLPNPQSSQRVSPLAMTHTDTIATYTHCKCLPAVRKLFVLIMKRSISNDFKSVWLGVIFIILGRTFNFVQAHVKKW